MMQIIAMQPVGMQLEALYHLAKQKAAVDAKLN